MICKHCDNSDVTVDDLQGVECSISSSNSSPCKSCMELANLENAMAILKMKRCDLKRNINRIHSPFIRIIPPEIIAMISGFANTNFTIIGNLMLSSVCSDWRRIVVGTPQLWSSIKIDLPSKSQISDMALRRATFIDEWLARSGQLPLYISLRGHHNHNEAFLDDSSTLEEYGPIFEILEQYSSRWHILNIYTIPLILLHFLVSDCHPLLEQLHITSEYFTWLYNIRKRIGFGIQWDTVTHISVEPITCDECFALLRLNPQLVHCTFHKVVGGVDDHLESPILSCSLT
jgi:hypothetical protein